MKEMKTREGAIQSFDKRTDLIESTGPSTVKVKAHTVTFRGGELKMDEGEVSGLVPGIENHIFKMDPTIQSTGYQSTTDAKSLIGNGAIYYVGTVKPKQEYPESKKWLQMFNRAMDHARDTTAKLDNHHISKGLADLLSCIEAFSGDVFSYLYAVETESPRKIFTIQKAMKTPLVVGNEVYTGPLWIDHSLNRKGGAVIYEMARREFLQCVHGSDRKTKMVEFYTPRAAGLLIEKVMTLLEDSTPKKAESSEGI